MPDKQNRFERINFIRCQQRTPQPPENQRKEKFRKKNLQATARRAFLAAQSKFYFMKQTTLNTADRATVNALCALMMEMDRRNDLNTDGHGTFGHLYLAIVSFVENQTGVDISNGGGRHGWNLGGNADFATDIQAVIDYELAEAIQRHARANDAAIITDRAGDVALLARHYDDEGRELIRMPAWPCDYRAPAAWHAMSPEQAAAATC